MSRKKLMPVLFLVCLSVPLAAMQPQRGGGSQASNVSYARVWVTDNISGGPQLDVISDSQESGFNLYADSHLAGGDPCVVAAVNKTGFSPFYPAGEGCTASQARSVRIYFPTGITVPGECVQPDGSNYDLARGQFFVSDYRILSSLFAKGGTDMRFGFFCGGSTYSILTDQNVPLVSLDANTRRVTNVGSLASTATLYQVVDGTTIPVNGSTNFNFPFEVTFQRVK